MSESMKQYPEWQKSFRDMQAVRDQRHAEQREKARQENAESERKAGYRLQQALMHFGIYLDPAPQVNLAEVDGYQFKLLGGNYNIGKGADGRETFAFDLVVQKLIPGRTVDDDNEFLRYRHVPVNPHKRRDQDGWDYELCLLADAFDELDEEIASDVVRDAERKARIEEQKLAPQNPESAEEKLLKVLRTFIRTEVANQLEI